MIVQQFRQLLFSFCLALNFVIATIRHNVNDKALAYLSMLI